MSDVPKYAWNCGECDKSLDGNICTPVAEIMIRTLGIVGADTEGSSRLARELALSKHETFGGARQAGAILCEELFSDVSVKA